MNAFFVRRPLHALSIAKRFNGAVNMAKVKARVLTKDEIQAMGHPLVMSFENLSLAMNGTGKAKAIWNLLMQGKNPLEECGIEESDPKYLSNKAKGRLLEILDGRPLIPGEVTEETLSECGTRKLLLKQTDGQSIESVLIPSSRYMRTTLCVSSQLGCDRGCKFCLTGKMGFIRNLSAPEIIAQVILATRASLKYNMPQLKNIVFMGMGDAGRNMEQVTTAVNVLIDTQRGHLSPNKITVSTVGPSPDIFDDIVKLSTTVAWSLHTPNIDLRKKLIPSSYKYSPIELRDGIIKAFVANRRPQDRTLMIACTLIDGINDSEKDAQDLADFVKPMKEDITKIIIDLIPYNDINFDGFSTPMMSKVNAFQEVLKANEFFCSVRIPRGNKDSAACGQLATKVIRKPRANRTATASAPSTESKQINIDS